MELREYQKTGIEFLSKKGRALLADGMGAGKTVQAMQAIEKLNAYPCIVVCPASVKINWSREVKMWLPHRTVQIVNGRAKPFEKADFIIINYDLLTARLTALKMMNASGVIFDEFHYAKNPKSKRTLMAKSLAWSIPVRFGLTGTPILNRPVELSSQLDILGHLQGFGGDWKFKQRYCGAQKKWTPYGMVWDFNGASNLEELRNRLFAGEGAIALRRKKEDILPELPAKQITGIPVDIVGKKAYKDAEEELMADLIERGLLGEGDSHDRRQIAEVMEKGGIGALATMRKVLALGKMKIAKQWIEDFLEGTEEKLVVFGHHRALVQGLHEAFSDIAVHVMGGDSQTNRQAAIDSFQTDPKTRLFFGNIQAAGEGITLTAASKVMFLELAWSPLMLEQCEDRCHRIGQKDSVSIYYMLGVGTLEEDLLDIIRTKRKVVNQVMD